MIIKSKAGRFVGSLLWYPLRTESIFVILLFWFIVALYVVAYFGLALVLLSSSVDFLELAASSSLLCLYFEYGLEVLKISQTDHPSPPVFSYETIKGNRFGKQVLFLAVVVAVAQYLNQQQLENLAFILVFAYIVLLPAMQITIATSDSFF